MAFLTWRCCGGSVCCKEVLTSLFEESDQANTFYLKSHVCVLHAPLASSFSEQGLTPVRYAMSCGFLYNLQPSSSVEDLTRHKRVRALFCGVRYCGQSPRLSPSSPRDEYRLPLVQNLLISAKLPSQRETQKEHMQLG